MHVPLSRWNAVKTKCCFLQGPQSNTVVQWDLSNLKSLWSMKTLKTHWNLIQPLPDLLIISQKPQSWCWVVGCRREIWNVQIYVWIRSLDPHSSQSHSEAFWLTPFDTRLRFRGWWLPGLVLRITKGHPFLQPLIFRTEKGLSQAIPVPWCWCSLIMLDREGVIDQT